MSRPVTSSDAGRSAVASCSSRCRLVPSASAANLSAVATMPGARPRCLLGRPGRCRPGRSGVPGTLRRSGVPGTLCRSAMRGTLISFYLCVKEGVAAAPPAGPARIGAATLNRRTEAGMTARILDGRATAAAIREDLTLRVAELARRGITPGLGTVLVGDDPGSVSYVNGKHRDCAQVGILSIRVDLPADATQQQVEEAVAALNADPACPGSIVQLPLPAGLDAQRVLERIDPAKDADGLHPMNLGRLVLGEPAPLPGTPRGIVELLRRFDVPIAGAGG